MLNLFTARILLVCALFQASGLSSNTAFAESEKGPLPPAQTPAQQLVIPDPDLNTSYIGIPSIPTAPKRFSRPQVKDSFRCDREFLYKGHTYPCDSFVQRDGERLRLIMADVPDAIQEIDTYQRNRKSLRTAAYLGTLGLVIFLGGLFISRSFNDPVTGSLNNTGQDIRRYTSIGGLGLTFGAVTYGFLKLNNNEQHIGNAVNDYNQAHPNTPIQLQFTAGFNL